MHENDYQTKAAKIKRYMGFADSFKPPTLSSSHQLINWVFILKLCID